MIYYALVFLVVGAIAGILNSTGMSTGAVQMSWLLFVIGMGLLVVDLVRRRSPQAVRHTG